MTKTDLAPLFAFEAARLPVLFPAVSVSRPRRLALAVRAWLFGGALLGLELPSAWAELPVPASVLVGAGKGSVLPPTVSGNNMTIRQLSDKATLDWKSFNIGPENSVRFIQPATTSVALNNIHQSDPSRIFGSLSANGQVYLVNQNGFVFGKDSQVNVNSLVATTLGIAEDTFQRGIVRAFEQRLPALATADGSKQLYIKDAAGKPLLDAKGQPIKIQILVEAGGKLKTNASDGRIILAAPSITNQGTVEAPGGQVIMAAAQDKVYLQLAGSDSNVNGLLVEVGTGGDVNNIGKVLAERGNASLIGFAVNQQGIASATTSVRINGSVRLLAREGIQDPTTTNGLLKPASTQRSQDLGDGLGTSATVNLASGSVTRVDLDADKTQTAIDSQPQLRSNIEISGHKVFLRNHSAVVATSGNVGISAVDDPTNPADKGDARIYLEKGSRIDVSGVKNVSLPMERNVLQVELRNNELRDAPLQRNGVLHGKTVAVDLRDTVGEAGNKHIPIADVQSALDRIARNIDERSTSGGTATLKSTGDVIAKSGSVLDFSGGSVAYRDGYIATTQLLDAQGRLYDIGTADPNRVYTGILGEFTRVFSKWGITERWVLPGLLGRGVFEKGYVEGAAAGSLNIAAFEAVIDGVLKGGTVDGLHQRLPSERADGGSLSIDLANGSFSSKQEVVFAQNQPVNSIGPGDALPRNASGSTDPLALTLDPQRLQNSGVRNIAITTNGGVKIKKGAQLELPVGGKLDLAAIGFDVQGSITAPSGTVTMKPSTAGLPSPVTLGAAAAIDVSGLWVNDWLDNQLGHAVTAASIDGGTVNLSARQGDLRLAKGSRIDAGGGAWLQGDKTLEAGKGGVINLSAATTVDGGAPSSLVLDGKVSSWALQHGGSLQLETNEVVIGPASAMPRHPGAATQPLLLSAGFFQQGGFADYDIRSNVYGLKLANGVRLAPLQRNLALSGTPLDTPTGDNPLKSAAITTLPDTDRKPVNLSLAYAGLLKQDRQESLSIGKGASIHTDPLASVKLSSDTSIFVNGTIDAPAGQIALAITTPSPTADSGFFASQGIWLGAGSQLMAQGVFESQPKINGLKTGEVLPGGTVSLTANRGYIVSQGQSLIDVSGSSARLDFLEPSASGVQRVQKTIPSAGGAVKLTAAEGIITDGTLKAKAGGEGVAGGSLSVELNRLNTNKAAPEDRGSKTPFPDDLNPNQPQSIIVSADTKPVLPAYAVIPARMPESSHKDVNLSANTGLRSITGITGTLPSMALDSGIPAGMTELPSSLNGKAWLSSGKINPAGFSSIALKTEGFNLSTQAYVNNILFLGDVSLKADRQIVLDSPSLAWSPLTTSNQGTVNLATAYAALGSTRSRIDLDLGSGNFSTTLAPEAKTGQAKFNVHAQGIDLVGGLSFDGYRQVRLDSAGDIRTKGVGGVGAQKDFQGELKVEGNLTLKADQVYPATLTDYRIKVTGKEKQGVTILGTGDATAPVYSAGGSLQIDAPTIKQHGTLKAPFGQLKLNATNTIEFAAGSLTSVSGSGLSIPFGRGSAGQNWLYPLNSQGSVNLVIDKPPEKRIALNGKNVILPHGAKVDLSGGGDLYAYEFIQGPGGSIDVLDSSSKGYTPQYAVIPGVDNILTPYDPLEFAAPGLQTGDSVYLSGGGGLAAGMYTLLPAHYALLPGAYLVTPRSDTADMVPGQSYTDPAGIHVVAGRLGVADTRLANARWQGFAVEAGAIARTRSEFKDYSANQFFTDKAAREETALPQLPKDGGSLALAATASLRLGASLDGTPATGGFGGQVDISGDKLAIVGRREDLASIESGTLGILAEDLNTLNAPSLLLGGLRSKDKNGQRVSVVAKQLEVAGDASLQGQEILLAAQDHVTIQSGATIASSGKTRTASPNLLVSNPGGNSDGALVRVSSSAQTTLIRDSAVSGNSGVLTVEAGAKLKAEGSMLLDSTKDTLFAGDIMMRGGSLALNSSKISFGNAPAHTSGLVLAKTQFDLDELRLTSASEVNLFGAVDLNAKQLSINAAAIHGFNNAGADSVLSGDVISLANTGATTANTGTGTGSLALNAGEIRLGAGNYAIGGFRQVAFNATGAILGQGRTTDALTGQDQSAGTGKLTVDATLNLKAARIGGEAGATTVVDATGHKVNIRSLANSPLGDAALGASWTVTADAIHSSGHFDLPSGLLKLEALHGDLTLAKGSAIEVSGRSEVFGNLVRYSPAGKVVLESASGDVILASGASINLAPAYRQDAAGKSQQTGDAGLLAIQAAQGQFDWSGNIDAHGAGKTAPDLRQGRLRMDVARFGAGGFSALNRKLAAAGFSEEVSLEQRLGDVHIAASDSVTAQQFQLSADQGKVLIDGKIDASGAQAGAVSIVGRNGIRLGATGKIDASASAAGEAGGSVSLDTVHRDDTGSGQLDLSAEGGVIDVSAGKNGAGGAIHLRTGRDADNTIAATAIHTTVRGAASGRSVLEAARVYDGQSTITAAEIATWQADTAGFMSAATQPANHAITLLPGIEVRSRGDLTLAEKWDFMDGSWVADPTDATGTQGQWQSLWRYADSTGKNTLPGFLTFRAGGDLNINAALTDAFATSPLPGILSLLRFQDTLQPGRSWSYNLVAGGNVNLAHSYTGLEPTDPTSGVTRDDLQVVVRTGTGDIDIKADGNIHFVANPDNPQAAAAVYTLGKPATYTMADLLNGSIPGIPAKRADETQADYLSRLNPAQMNQLLRYGSLNLAFEDVALPGSRFLAEYPDQGGSIHFKAAGNIEGIQTGQLMSDWLVRGGNWSGDPATQSPTVWGINISSDFKEDSAVSGADGNLIFTKGNRGFNQNVGALGGGNVSVEAGGDVSGLSVMIPTTGKTVGAWNEDHQWVENRTVVNGGGDLQVSAGGDIVGGEYFTGLGTARLEAGGSVAHSANGVGTILELGDAHFTVQARGDLNLGTVLNPTVVAQKAITDPLVSNDTFFFTYNPSSAVSLSSIGGNLILQNDVNAIREARGLDTNAGSGFEFAVYPGTLQAAALSGDIRIDNSFTLFPSSQGKLELLAGGNISTEVLGRQININVSDADVDLLPSVANPAQGLEGSVTDGIFLAQERLNPTTYDNTIIHASTPVHQGNTSSSSIIAQGDIAFPSATPVAWYLPHESQFIAGQDIRNLSVSGQNLAENDISLVYAGRDIRYDSPIDENGAVVSIDRKVAWGGPGQLQVLAGRNINLGSSAGLQTVGNLVNTALPSTGSSISVLAGLSDKIDYSGFIHKYSKLTAYRSQLQGLDGKTGRQQLKAVLAVLFNEIKRSAAAAAAEPDEAKRAPLYKRGFDAIQALFPGKHYQGDLALVFSQIKTLSGGDINILVPGGKVDVGLAGKNGGIAKKADELGIVAQQAGNVNAFTSGDFNVNQSRVFTMLGGDVVLWSSDGSIDAGKGAKGSISAPPPITSIDKNGNLVTTFPPVVSGSGIQAVSPEDKTQRQGNVYLAAPHGIVDAGEAGIGGGQVVIAATAVIGASNIQASGGTVGVPAAVAAPVVVPGADAAAASVAKSAAQQATETATKPAAVDEKQVKSTLSSLQADVLGFGECSISDVRDGKAGCGG